MTFLYIVLAYEPENHPVWRNLPESLVVHHFQVDSHRQGREGGGGRLHGSVREK